MSALAALLSAVPCWALLGSFLSSPAHPVVCFPLGNTGTHMESRQRRTQGTGGASCRLLGHNPHLSPVFCCTGVVLLGYFEKALASRGPQSWPGRTNPSASFSDSPRRLATITRWLPAVALRPRYAQSVVAKPRDPSCNPRGPHNSSRGSDDPDHHASGPVSKSTTAPDSGPSRPSYRPYMSLWSLD